MLSAVERECSRRVYPTVTAPCYAGACHNKVELASCDAKREGSILSLQVSISAYSRPVRPSAGRDFHASVLPTSFPEWTSGKGSTSGRQPCPLLSWSGSSSC